MTSRGGEALKHPSNTPQPGFEHRCYRYATSVKPPRSTSTINQYFAGHWCINVEQSTRLWLDTDVSMSSKVLAYGWTLMYQGPATRYGVEASSRLYSSRSLSKVKPFTEIKPVQFIISKYETVSTFWPLFWGVGLMAGAISGSRNPVTRRKTFSVLAAI